MKFSNKNEKYVADILYQSVVEEEKQWKREKGNKHDIAIAEELINELRNLGYNYKYLADITNRDNSDKELLSIVLKYIGRFNDEGISAELVGVVGKRGNTSATEVILMNYLNSSDKNKRMQAIFYDNALYNIRDKKYIDVYLDILRNPQDAIRFPLTMIMLGRWRIDMAKPYFLQYLNSKLLYLNEHTSDLVFIALEALSYYQDPDSIILNSIERKLNSNDKDVVSAAKKAIKKLKKNNKTV